MHFGHFLYSHHKDVSKEISQIWFEEKFTVIVDTPISSLEIIANSDRRHGLEVDSNQEPTLVLGARPLPFIDFN